MGKKILVVDDEEDILMMIEARLSAGGFDIVTAANGSEGLEKARSENPDLIISDVVMPKMDGFALYKELKQDEALSSIPVLILTARGKMEDTFRSVGVEDFLTKPFDSQELIDTVNRKLESSGAQVGISDLKTEEGAKPAEDSEAKTEETETAESNLPKVFVISPWDDVTSVSGQALKDSGYQCEAWNKEDDYVKQAEGFNPGLVILDVFVNDKPSTDVIIRLRKSKVLKKVPILIFSYFDKDKLEGVNLNKRKMDLENAKVACMNAGAKDSIGDFDKSALTSAVTKHLPVQ